MGPNSWSRIFCFLVSLLHFQRIACFNVTDVVLYLSTLGFLPPEFENSDVGNLISNESLRSALVEFQVFSGINVTGVADNETLELMRSPRCGMPDKMWQNSRSENYVLGPFRWHNKNLTYKITKYSSNKHVTREETDSVMEKVFNIWSNNSNLVFTKTDSGNMDIEIRFERRSHGDGNPFDGPGRVLAHGFFPGPGWGGDVHMDDDEKWSASSNKSGIKLDKVALHELGHALGLNHSRVRSAIMYAYYSGGGGTLQLHKDDIDGIQALYGKKPTLHVTTPKTVKTVTAKVPFPRWTTKKPPPTTTRSPSTTTVRGIPGIDICNNSLMEYTLFRDGDNKTYFLSGSYVWEITNDGIPPQYPQLISKKWRKHPGHVDAAFYYEGITYFFRRNYVWGYRNSYLIQGYPKYIKKKFPDLRGNVDSALVWNQKIYIFKGWQYWKYPATFYEILHKKYPRVMANWAWSLPSHIQASVSYDKGVTYFFKRDKYWKYNDRTRTIEWNRQKPYPRSVKKWWLFCEPDGRRFSNNDRMRPGLDSAINIEPERSSNVNLSTKPKIATLSDDDKSALVLISLPNRPYQVVRFRNESPAEC